MRYMVGIRILGFVMKGDKVVREEPMDEFICYQPTVSMAAESAVEASQESKNKGLTISIVDTNGLGTVAFPAEEMPDAEQRDMEKRIAEGFRGFEILQSRLEEARENCDCPVCSQGRQLLN